MTRPGEVAETFVAAISRHDPDTVARCFAENYEDEAPTRRGEVVRGRDEVRANFACMFTSMPGRQRDDHPAGGTGERGVDGVAAVWDS